jgi:hypothetical protein
MAEQEKPQKAIISMKDLPPVSSQNNYVVRYRVVSDDKNSSTEWSEPLKVYALATANVSGSLQLSSNKDIVSIVWGDENNRPSYDIFVKFGSSTSMSNVNEWQNYFYHGTSLVHNYSVLVPSSVITANNVNVSANYMVAKIQVASSENKESAPLVIYEISTPLHLV